jgi:hypothetical protein
MTTIISLRNAVLLASAFIACIMGTAGKSFAQPPPCPPPPCDSCECTLNCFCDTCLQVTKDTNHCLCQPSDCGPSCITWALINHCSSCLDTIVISGIKEQPFTTCCVVVQDPSHGTWNQTQINPSEVMYTAPTNTCLPTLDTSGGIVGILQVTTCGLIAGDQITVQWRPLDPPCNNTSCDTPPYSYGYNYPIEVATIP